MMKYIFTFIGITAWCLNLPAQETGRQIEHTATFKSQYVQIKDEFNYGLVNRGLNLAGEYTLVSSTDRNIFMYEAELGFGVNYNQGLGMIWSLKPFDLFYGFNINKNQSMSVTLGPYLAGYYKWQLYPELQSGHMFWLSSYEIGPRIQISLPVKNRILNVSLSSTVASLNSRPEFKTEEYYYSLTFSDFVKNPHSNMTLGSVNVFNHTDFILELKHPEKGFSISYEFEYMGYLDTPAFRYMAHSINLNWKIENKKSK
jgi:hypothetical protein